MLRVKRGFSPFGEANRDCSLCLPPMKKQAPHLRLVYRKLEFLLCCRERVEANMDWINCNSCCRQPGDERERTFTLTSCGHIFCDLCLSRAESKRKCAVCSTACQLIQLSSKMKPDAEMFFQEPATLLKKQFMQVNRLLEFQKDHRIRLVSFHRKVLQKYKVLEKQHSSAASQVQEMECRYSSAKARIQELEHENQKLRSMLSSLEHCGAGGSSSSLARKSPSPQVPQVSPEGTIISPGRLTLVKGRGPPSATPPTSAHMLPYGPAQAGGTPSRQFSPVSYQYLPPHHHPQARHSSGPPGAGYYRSISPAASRKCSPVRTVSGSMNQLSLALPSHTHSSKSYMHPPHHPQQPPRAFTPSSVSSVLTSPDTFLRQPHDLRSCKKYSM